MKAMWETPPESEDPRPRYSDPCTHSESAVLGPGALQWWDQAGLRRSGAAWAWCSPATLPVGTPHPGGTQGR